MKIQQKHLILSLLAIIICVSLPTVFSRNLKKRLSKTNHRKNLPSMLLIKRLLGKGGFGQVFEATEKNKRKNKYAIKVAIEPTKRIELAHLKNEIKILQKLSLEKDNEFKIDYYGTYKDDKYIYIIMELMRTDMFYVINKGHLEDNNQRIGYVLQFAKNLKYLHLKNIVHRDLKTENLMFNIGGYLRIVDFGIAKELKNLDEKFTPDTDDYFVGTAGYLPIEILEKKPYSYKCDIFTFGLIAYLIIFGQEIEYYNEEKDSYNYNALIAAAVKTDNSLRKKLDLDGNGPINFFQKIFQTEENRASLETIINTLQNWLNNLGQNYNLIKVPLDKSYTEESKKAINDYFLEINDYKYTNWGFSHTNYEWKLPAEYKPNR